VKSSEKKSAVSTTGYDVGYRKPPTQHRFVKGRSGNPKGRPPKRRVDPHEEQMKGLVIDEAYRRVSVREGDRVRTMPVIQAVIRSVAVIAAKGQPRAQRIFADWVRWVESDRRGQKLEYLETVIAYKAEWELELERRQHLGLTGNEPIPHPDDIVVDFGTGDVTIKGPMTKKQKAELEQLIEQKQDWEEDVRMYERSLRKKPDDPDVLRALGQARRFVQIVSELEKGWPSRKEKAIGRPLRPKGIA
jgi:hypothetical protein